MVKFLLKYGLLAVFAVLVYNYFAGTPDEKAQSKAVFKEVGDVAKGIGSVVKSEKGKFDAGKYDTAIDKLTGSIQKLKSEAKDSETRREVAQLEQKSAGLKKDLKEHQTNPDSPDALAKAQKIKKQLEDLSDLVAMVSGKMDSQ
jgi:cytochrome c556